MTLEKLNEEMIAAMKSGDKTRKQVISNMIGDVKKAAIDNKCRDNITEDLVNEVLLKCQKTAHEMIETCPPERKDLLNDYQKQFAIICEFAPVLITNRDEIKSTILDILNGEFELTKSNRGKIMKIVSGALKGKADMRTVSAIVGEMLV